MNNWWWNVGFSGLTRGLDIPDAAFKFLHFGNAVLEADIGINIAAAVASGGIGAVVPVVKMVKIGGSACIGSVCDCAKLANQAREGCDATNVSCHRLAQIVGQLLLGVFHLYTFYPLYHIR